MPRRAKGPRLYLKQRAGREPVWIIRDGQHERSTGCAEPRLGEAERALAAYIAEKWSPEQGAGIRSRRDPAQVGVVEVLALYASERAPQLKADPKSTAGFIAHLNGWWGDKTVSEVKRSTCKAYVAHRTAQATRNSGRMVSDQTARRELETLSAAIGYWHGEDTLTTRPKVWLPEKPESSRDALTRDQAAALLKAARGYRWDAKRERWAKLTDSGAANRAHLKRFVLIGLYTGSRSRVIASLLREESPKDPFQDLERGMIYRRGKAERDTANKRRPVVKLPPRLLAHMRRWDRLDRLLKDCPPSVVHHGGMAVRKVRRGFAACVAHAGLPAEITPHWLRHTAATWLMERGADIWDACGYLGMTPKTLIDNYGHHRADHQAGAIKAIGGKR